MKKFLAVIALASSLMLLQGCPTETTTTLQGSADINIQDNLTQCQIRQNGTTIFVKQDGGLDPYIMGLDAGVVYPDVWVNLTVSDAERVTPLTQTELDIINGNL